MKKLTALVVACCLSSAAAAKSYDTSVTVIRGNATALSQTIPAYDDRDVRRGQEGWVRLAYGVTADGQLVDPIVLDSVGGASFEHAAMAATRDWTFAPGDADAPLNIVDIRFAVNGARDDASKDFVRRYRRMMANIANDKLEDGREQLHSAVEHGGWNLYEQTMLQLVTGLIAAIDEDDFTKLDSFWRAINIGDRKALGDKNRINTLRQIFELEHKRGQFSHATVTRSLIAGADGGAETLQRIAEQSDEILSAFASQSSIHATGEIRDRSVPHWSYVPQRKVVGFEDIIGSITGMDVRCAAARLRTDVIAGERYTLPQDGGACRVFVFGEPGSQFRFIEYKGISDNEYATARVVAY